MLHELLSRFHYTTEQQESLIKLIYITGCFDPITLENSLTRAGFDEVQTASIICQIKGMNLNIWQRDYIGLDIQALLQTDALENSVDNALKLLDWFTIISQEKFFARPLGIERWEMQEPEWLQENRAATEEIIKKLGIVNRIVPQMRVYDIMIILGATAPVMLNRIAFAKELVDKYNIDINALILLTSDRLLSAPDQPVVQCFNEDERPKTEAELFYSLFQQTKKETFTGIPIELICTPSMNSEKRPTRIDTLAYLQQYSQLFQHSNRILFVSSAPDLQAQNADIEAVLNENVKFQTVGPGINIQTNKTLTRSLSALGGYIWSQYETVAAEISPAVERSVLIERKKQLKTNKIFKTEQEEPSLFRGP